MEGNKTEKINLADISRWDIFVKHYISPRSYDWVLAALRDLDPIGSCVAVSAPNGSGKALSVDTEIPTPRGFVRMGDLAEGDLVYAPDGSECSVIKTSGVMLGHKCYRVVFSDGSEVIADAEHLWDTDVRTCNEVYVGNRRSKLVWGYERKTATTEEIKNTLFYFRGGYSKDKKKWGGAAHSIPVTVPVVGRHTDMGIGYYFLGAWLGDGTSSNADITFHENDISTIN